jgi:hypothetical protein
MHSVFIVKPGVTLCPRTLSLSLPRTTGIADHTNSNTNKELHPKTIASRKFPSVRGVKIIHKEAQGTHPWSPQRNPEKNPPKSAESTEERKHQRGSKRPTKITMPKLLYKPWKIHTGQACLLNIHPSLKISPWSSQASLMENLGKIGREKSKSKWTRVSRDGCHHLSSKFIWRQTKG